MGFGVTGIEKRKTILFSCEFCEISKNTSFTEHLRTTASVAKMYMQKRKNSYNRTFTLGNSQNIQYIDCLIYNKM